LDGGAVVGGTVGIGAGVVGWVVDGTPGAGGVVVVVGVGAVVVGVGLVVGGAVVGGAVVGGAVVGGAVVGGAVVGGAVVGGAVVGGAVVGGAVVGGDCGIGTLADFSGAKKWAFHSLPWPFSVSALDWVMVLLSHQSHAQAKAPL
jgi:hypothetical protein